jgi:asparagine synthase (glutamine-hydrolysing)
VLRRALEDRVPATVFTRPKQGFDVPLRDWFRGPLAHRLAALADHSSSIYEFVEPRAAARVVQEHRVGRRDHARTIWRLLMLDQWMRLLAANEFVRPVTISGDVDALLGRASADGALVRAV